MFGLRTITALSICRSSPNCQLSFRGSLGKTTGFHICKITTSNRTILWRGHCKHQELSRGLSSFNRKQDRHCHDRDTKGSSYSKSLLYAGMLVAAAAAGLAYVPLARYGKQEEEEKRPKQKPPPNDAAEREYTRKQVADHNSLEKGVWITYKGSVYDITNFIRHHPGGSHTIMMGAGGDVEPFWDTYTVHQAIEVQNLLSTYKIGVVKDDKTAPVKSDTVSKSDVPPLEGPYANDPERSNLLIVHSKQPFNAETPPNFLVETHITPTSIFFVRNHLPVPEVDLGDYQLEIYIEDEREPNKERLLASFTLDELKSKFKPHTIEAVMQCSGNRRSDLKKLKEIKGLDWKAGAIGNATWTGVRFLDLVDSIGVDKTNKEMIDKIRHVQVEGLDCDMTGQSYGASITADVAFNPMMDVILAYEMNGKPLTRDHGFPLRFVAPGIAGARCVKWLSKILLSSEESHSHWQRNDYKSFSPNVDMFNIEYDKAVSIQEMPVQSAICQPETGQTVLIKTETNKVPCLGASGYAYSGGGKNIVRVDVSSDNGTTWTTATILEDPNRVNMEEINQRRNRTWSWCRWSANIPLPESILSDGQAQLTILCRAFDSAYNSQPERAETVWNVRGVVNNSWHRVTVNVKIEG